MSDNEIIIIPPTERAMLALSSTQTERDLIVLAGKNADITIIKNKAGRDQAHGAAMEIKRARLTIERTAKEARDDATKFSKAVIAEEKRLIGIIEPEESRLLVLRNAWDSEQERIRLESEAAEQRRIDAINAAIDSIRAVPATLVNADSQSIARAIESLEQTPITEDSYHEFIEKARHFTAETVMALRGLHTAAAEREAEAKRIAEERARIKAEQEAEAARLAAERAELERLRAEAQAAAKAEAARMAAERAAHEAKIRAEQESARAAEAEREHQAQAERDQLQAELAALREAMRAREAAEQEREQENLAPVEVAEVAEAAEVAEVELAPVMPEASALIACIADTFVVDVSVAREWLVARADEIAAFGVGGQA